MSYEELREKVVVQRNVSYKKYETGKLRPDGKPGFNTPTGRVELYSTMFRQFGEDPLPYYEEPQFSPVSTPEKMEEYPFVLTTGARTYAFFHSEHRQIPRLRELNPNIIETAQSMGASPMQIVCRVMLPESVPSLISNATIAVTTVLGYSAMSGIIGGGGLGKIAIDYGYYRYKYLVMFAAVVLLIILVQIFQSLGTHLATKSDKRLKK